MKKFFLSFVFLTISFADIIVVASDGDNINSAVSKEASRSSYYVVFDTTKNIINVEVNNNKNVKGGASQKLITFLKSKNTTKFIAGNIGSKLEEALKNSNIKYEVFNGSVKNSVEK